MPVCRSKGCTAYAASNGLCAAHNSGKSYKKDTDADSSAPVIVEVKTIKGPGYFGGGANAPHVHVYPGGAHLKLGSHRYNLVQNDKKYSAVKDAYEALDGHPLGSTLRPWVSAALKYFGFSE
ncbi:MAG: hypothetical protein J0H27_15090 [Xanthomonadales bacterium]|nr:hypothetical protein [Xanthomonadales bacterium]